MTIWLKQAALIGLAGFVGAILRFSVTLGVNRIAAKNLAESIKPFPIGTLVVNLTGCFFLAMVLSWLRDREIVPDGMHLAITVGFLGAYTTFSTFAVEVYDLFRSGNSTHAAFYLLLSIGLGLLAVWLGFLSGRRLASYVI